MKDLSLPRPFGTDKLGDDLLLIPGVLLSPVLQISKHLCGNSRGVIFKIGNSNPRRKLCNLENAPGRFRGKSRDRVEAVRTELSRTKALATTCQADVSM